MRRIYKVWVPSTTQGEWHLFVVTTSGLFDRTTSNVVGVAYGRFTEAGMLTNVVNKDADAEAPWYLDPYALDRYRTQRVLGWDGSNAEVMS